MSIFRRQVSVTQKLLQRYKREEQTRDRRNRRLLSDEIVKSRETFVPDYAPPPETTERDVRRLLGLTRPKEEKRREPLLSEEEQEKLRFYSPVWESEVMPALQRGGLNTKDFLALGEQEQLLLIDPNTNPITTAARIGRGGQTLGEVGAEAEELAPSPGVRGALSNIGMGAGAMAMEADRWARDVAGTRIAGALSYGGAHMGGTTPSPVGPLPDVSQAIPSAARGTEREYAQEMDKRVQEVGAMQAYKEFGEEYGVMAEIFNPINAVPIPVLDPIAAKLIAWPFKGAVWATKAGASKLRSALARAITREGADSDVGRILYEAVGDMDQSIARAEPGGEEFAEAEFREQAPEEWGREQARKAMAGEERAVPLEGAEEGLERLERDVVPEELGKTLKTYEGTIYHHDDIETLYRLAGRESDPEREALLREGAESLESAFEEAGPGTLEFISSESQMDHIDRAIFGIAEESGVPYLSRRPPGGIMEGQENILRRIQGEEIDRVTDEASRALPGEELGGFTSVEYVDVELPPGWPRIAGAAPSPKGPPLVEGGIAPSLDLWRRMEIAHFTGPMAIDFWRRRANRISEVPYIRELMTTLAGPASRAGVDPTYRAGVLYRMVEEVQQGELNQRMARFTRDFPFKIGKDSKITVGPVQERIAFTDVFESYYRGEGKYTFTPESFTPEQAAWLDDAKKLIDDVAEQYEVISGEKIRTPEGDYFPRFVTDDKGNVRIGGRPGKKQPPILERLYAEMELALERGVKYEDPVNSLRLYSQSLQKMMRDDLAAYVALEDDVIKATAMAEDLIPPEVKREISQALDGLKGAKREAIRERSMVQASRTEAARTEQLLRGRLSGARAAQEFEAGRIAGRAQRGPARPGPRFRRAETATGEARGLLEEFRGVAREIPRPTRKARGVSPRAQAALVSAETRYNTAKKVYTRAMNKARSRAMRGGRDEMPGIVLGPAFADSVISSENFKKFHSVIGPGNRALKPFEVAASIPRLLVTGLLDVGQMMIQMLPMMVTHPIQFGKAIGRGFQAMLRPKDYLRWIENAPEVKYAARHQVDLGGSEFTQAAGDLLAGTKGTLGSKLGPLKVAPRGFDGMLAAARVYEFDSLARIATKGGTVDTPELYRIGRYVNTKLGTPNIRGLGVSATQSQVESAFVFFSQRYTRSVLGMLGHAMGKGVIANDARRALGSMLFAGSAAFYGLARSTGMSHQEALERINPLSGGKYMSIPIGGNEFGLGSAYRSFMKFAGDMVVADNWDFDSWGEGATDNPVVRFLRGRTSPLTGTIVDAITGEDFIGQEVNLDEFVDNPAYLMDYAMDKFLPLNIRAYTEARGSLTSKIGAATLETVGGRTRPRSPYELLEEAREEVISEKGLKGNYDEIKERDRVLANEIDESPKVKAAIERIEEERRRFPESKETKYYGAAEEEREKVKLEQEEDDKNLANYYASGGEEGMEPRTWKDRLSSRQTALAGKTEGMREALGIEYDDLKSEPGTINAALDAYYEATVEEYTDQTTGEVDWDSFFAEREKALSQLESSDRPRVEEFLNRFDTDLIRAFERLRPAVTEYYNIPQEERGARETWRNRNPEGDAALFLMGNTSGVMSYRAEKIAKERGRAIFGREIEVPRIRGGGGGESPFLPKLEGGISGLRPREMGGLVGALSGRRR